MRSNEFVHNHVLPIKFGISKFFKMFVDLSDSEFSYGETEEDPIEGSDEDRVNRYMHFCTYSVRCSYCSCIACVFVWYSYERNAEHFEKHHPRYFAYLVGIKESKHKIQKGI